MIRRTLVWVLKWRDDYCLVDGISPDFLQSIHRTKRGAVKEAERLRELARRPSCRRSGKVTMHYRIDRHIVLD